MLKESPESGQIFSGNNDILTKHWALLNTMVEYELKASIIHRANISIPWWIVLSRNL